MLASRLAPPPTPLRYADGLPKPYWRGWLHLLQAVACAVGSVLTATHGLFAFSVALATKAIPYAASAWFHCYPFAANSPILGVALLTDLTTIPLSISATAVPFVSTAAEFSREASLAACVFGANAVFAFLEQRELVPTTRSVGSSTPRLVVLTLYTGWILAFIGTKADLTQWPSALLLSLMVVTMALAGACASLLGNGRVVPVFTNVLWHSESHWSVHEDMHVLILCADVCWATLALRQP